MNAPWTVDELIEQVVLYGSLVEKEDEESSDLKDLDVAKYEAKTVSDILTSWLNKAKGDGEKSFEAKAKDVLAGAVRGAKKGVHDPIYDLIGKLMDPKQAEKTVHDFATAAVNKGVDGAKAWIKSLPKTALHYLRGTGKHLDRLIVGAGVAYPELKGALKDIRTRLDNGRTSEAEARKQVFLAISRAVVERRRKRAAIARGVT